MTPGPRPDDGKRLTRWLNEARGGNKEALRHLCASDCWQRWLIGIPGSLPPRLRSKVDPEDVLVETVEQAWQDIGKLKDVSTLGFHRWIAGICRQGVADTIRHHEQPRCDARREKPSPSLSRAAALRDDHTPSKSAVLHEQLAKITDVDISVTTVVTEIGKIRRTLPYMSHEQARGNPDEIDLRSDAYSLGVILYELLNDQLPYDVSETRAAPVRKPNRPGRPKKNSATSPNSARRRRFRPAPRLRSARMS
jgi:serine/threonine protein kinase